MDQQQPKMVQQFNPDEQEDPHYSSMVHELERIAALIAENKQERNDYIFNHEEFVDSLQYVVADQLSILRGEKVSIQEFSKRFDRWFVFCDGIINMGISCVYNQKALESEDYDTIYKNIRINAQFTTAFLKPRGIKVAFTHKSEEVKKNYKWLAMPCLLITDDQGVEQEIAITPSPNGSVWWLEILSQFHASYNWDWNDDEVPASTVANPYAALPLEAMIEEQSTEITVEEKTTHAGVMDEIVPAELPVTAEEEEAFTAIPESRRWGHKIMRDKDGKFEGMALYPIPTEKERARLAGIEIKGVEFKSSGTIKMKPEYEYKYSDHGPGGTKQDNEKHYIAINQDSISEFVPEQKGDGSVSPFFNGVTGQRCAPNTTEAGDAAPEYKGILIKGSRGEKFTDDEMKEALKFVGASDQDYFNAWTKQPEEKPQGMFTKVLNFFKRILNIKGK